MFCFGFFFKEKYMSIFLSVVQKKECHMWSAPTFHPPGVRKAGSSADESLCCDLTQGRPSGLDINNPFLNFTFPRPLLLTGLLIISTGHSFNPCSVIFSSDFTHVSIYFIHSNNNIFTTSLCRLLQRSAQPEIACCLYGKELWRGDSCYFMKDRAIFRRDKILHKPNVNVFRGVNKI